MIPIQNANLLKYHQASICSGLEGWNVLWLPMGEECLVRSCALFLLCTTIRWWLYCFVSTLKPTWLCTGWILRCLSRNFELCAHIQCHCVWKSRSACLINLDVSLVLPCIRLERPFWKSHVCNIGCVSRQKEAKRENCSFCDQEELESNLGLAGDFLVSIPGTFCTVLFSRYLASICLDALCWCRGVCLCGMTQLAAE